MRTARQTRGAIATGPSDAVVVGCRIHVASLDSFLDDLERIGVVSADGKVGFLGRRGSCSK
jgi:hypothetical protein